MEKWRSVADLATQKCELKLASEALRRAKDHGGLLLLATSSGDKAAVEHLAQGKIPYLYLIELYLIGYELNH